MIVFVSVGIGNFVIFGYSLSKICFLVCFILEGVNVGVVFMGISCC